jgi:hypothetical protein
MPLFWSRDLHVHIYRHVVIARNFLCSPRARHRTIGHGFGVRNAHFRLTLEKDTADTKSSGCYGAPIAIIGKRRAAALARDEHLSAAKELRKRGNEETRRRIRRIQRRQKAPEVGGHAEAEA